MLLMIRMSLQRLLNMMNSRYSMGIAHPMVFGACVLLSHCESLLVCCLLEFCQVLVCFELCD